MLFLVVLNMSKIYAQWIKTLAVFTFYIEVRNAQRRVTNGRKVLGDKRYMVYLLQSPPFNYSGWTCGGAIISRDYILTSAACVRTNPYSYVIAGYKKYVNAKNMLQDDCISQTRRKIISYCHPKKFELHNTYRDDPTWWTLGDIAIARVNIRFDFTDESYYYLCSYPPGPVAVNFHYEFHKSEITDVITLGWGHAKYYRPPGETMDLNEDYLHYSSGTITANSVCEELHPTAFSQPNINFDRHMKSFWICVNKAGNLDENGDFIIENRDYYNTCNNTYDSKEFFDHYGRQNTANRSDTDCYDGNSLRTQNRINATSGHVGGFCQNDHGGPLVTWIGGRETVVGVATTFTVAENWECRTPYLYTNTASINKLLACFLWTNFTSNRRRSIYCDEVITDLNYTQQDVTWSDDFS